MMTLHKQTSLFTEEQLMCLQVDSHANHTALPENEKAKKMSAIYGRKCLELYEKFPRHTLWGKTFMGLLIGTGDWFSTRCKLTWKMKGTKYNRLYFQLVAKTPPIKESEFGLLPTPRAMEVIEHPMKQAARLKDRTGNKLNNLSSAAKYGMLPTPTTMDNMAPKTDKAIIKEMTITRPGRTQLSNLRDVVARQMMPTPSTRDYKGTNGEEHMENGTGRKHLDQLPNRLKFQHGIDGQLNPRFVAEMMGFPPNWTELPFLSGETKALKDMVTP